jgi:hypothetical protein
VDGAVITNGCLRSQTRTFTATDACTNSATTTRMVTWTVDTEVPVITATGTTLTLGCNPSAADINAALGTATATDNCSVGTPTATDGAVTGTCTKSQTRTWNVSDGCGNPAVAVSRTVTWTSDVVAPVIVATGTTLALGCNPSAADINAALGTATATDNCSVGTPTATDGAVTGTCMKSQTRTWNVSDGCGNPAVVVSRTVTWRADITTPTITCAPNKTIGCSELPVFDDPTATDGCGGVEISDGILTQSGNTFTMTWTATDACGNTATCSQTITQSCSGCSQGFWKTHGELWDQGTDYTVDRMPGTLTNPVTPGGTFVSSTNFWTYFNIPVNTGGISNNPNLTMFQANNLGGGNCKNLARQGVAALLGKAAFGDNYAYNGDFAALYQAIRTALLSGNCSVLAIALDNANNNENNSVCSGLNNLPHFASPVITGISEATAPQLKVESFPNPYTEQNFSLKINAPVTGKATIDFFTIDGNRISEITRTITANIDEIVNFKVPGINKATIVYMVRIGNYTTRGMVLSPNN